MTSLEFQKQFEDLVTHRFTLAFVGKVVDQATVPSIVRNIVIGVLYDMHKEGKLPPTKETPPFQSGGSTAYYRKLADLVYTQVYEGKHVKYNTNALVTHLYAVPMTWGVDGYGMPKKVTYAPTQTFQNPCFEIPLNVQPALVPDKTKGVLDNISEMAKALADSMAIDKALLLPMNLPPSWSDYSYLGESHYPNIKLKKPVEETLELKEVEEAPRIPSFGRKLKL